MNAHEAFLEAGRDGTMKTCLEMGTLQWEPGVRTAVADQWFSNIDYWVKTDIEDGPDVDIPADAHDLKPFFDDEFDLVISRSVWEHLARPWLAAHAAFRVTKPGGLIFVDAPQTFPLHGYPSDYFRFSAEAMKVMFEDAGYETIVSSYYGPCTITPAENIPNWNHGAPSWLNAQYTGRKPL